MKKTLLEKAQEVPAYNKYDKVIVTDEHIELAIAWISGNITTKQISSVLFGDEKGTHLGGRVLYRVATYLRYAITNKKYKIVKI